MKVVLPFPPASLAGHNSGQWYNRDRVVATYRAEAFHLTRNAMLACGYKAPEAGDIAIRFTFCPPNDRGDRVNYPIRIKAQIDGIAEALGVNDKRFLPAYFFLPPAKPGRVEVQFFPENSAGTDLPNPPVSAMENERAERCANTGPALTIDTYHGGE